MVKGKYVKIRCANCETEYVVVNANTSDGIRCKNCNGGPLVVQGYTNKPEARKGNIELQVESYCLGCEEFMPVRKTERVYAGCEVIGVNITVQCRYMERCKRIADRVMKC